MSDVTYTQRPPGPVPNDGVPTYGWRFETLRRRKVRCAICDRKKRYGVVAHDADVTDPNLKLVCKQCFDEMP